MKIEKDIRISGHWDREDVTERVTRKEWREMLLARQDRITFQGRVRQLEAKNLGAGVYEISKKENRKTFSKEA